MITKTLSNGRIGGSPSLLRWQAGVVTTVLPWLLKSGASLSQVNFANGARRCTILYETAKGSAVCVVRDRKVRTRRL